MDRSFGAAFWRVPAQPLVCLIALLSGLTTAAHSQSPSSTTVYAAVTDGKGKPVTGLSAADFAVEVGGTQARVTSVVPATDPLSMAIVLSLGKNDMTFVRDMLTEITKTLRANNPDNRVGLTKWEDFTVNFDLVGSRGDPLISLYSRRFPNPVEVLRGVVGSAQALANETTSRHIVLVVAPIGSMGSQAQSQQQLQSFDGLLKDSHAALWVITVENIYSPAVGKGEGLLSLAAVKSGGHLSDVLTTRVLATTAHDVLTLITSEYAVTYDRPATAESSEAHIGVQRAGTTVFAPSWPY